MSDTTPHVPAALTQAVPPASASAAAPAAARRAVLGGSALAAFAALAGSAAAAFPRAAPGQLYVIAELVAQPGKEQALRDLLVPFATGAAAESGCLHYTLMEVQKTPGRFLTFEIWSDQYSFNGHMATPQIKAAGEKLPDLLAQPFSQIFLDALT